MKKLIRNALFVCLGIGLVGCEWEGGGDGNSWNSRYNFVNFSGSYRPVGGYLVSAYSDTAGGGTTTSTGGFIPPIETVNANFSGNSISFTTDFVPIKPGSVTVTFNNGSLGSVTDNGAGQLVGSYLNAIPGEHPASGTVVYENGQISVFFSDILGIQNAAIRVRYTVDSGTESSSGGSSGASPGGSIKIYVFNVQQEGNKLEIIDNTGCAYHGSFGSIRTTSGTDQDSTFATYSDGEEVVATFEAKGRSAASVDVKMVGNFQATIANVLYSADGSAVTMTLKDRRILGTWIESNGKTGDINGQAASVGTSTTTTTETTTP